MNVLIVRLGALGDVVHTLPAVSALRNTRPDWRIDWVVDERWLPVLASDGPSPIVSQAIAADTRAWKASPLSRSTFKDFAAFRRLAGSYDLVVDMQGTLRSSAIAWLARGPAGVAGFADPREPLAARFYRHQVGREGVHIVQQNAALLSRACDIPLEPASVHLPRTAWAEEWSAEQAHTDRLCVLSPRAGWPAKQWPARNFGALACALYAMGLKVVVNAQRQDDVVAQEVVAASGGTASIVVCNVTGLVALLRKAVLVIGGDSGPAHIAAALGTPVVALFGPTDPARNRPWGNLPDGSGPIRVLRRPESQTSYSRKAAADAGLAAMAVEDVLHAARELL